MKAPDDSSSASAGSPDRPLGVWKSADRRLSLRLRPRGAGSATMQVTGVVDQEHAEDLQTELLRALEVCPKGLAVDLAAVRSCTPAGLSALIKARARARELGSPLTLTAVSPPVAHLLDATGTWLLFDQA